MRYVERLYSDNIVRVLLKYSDDLSTNFWTEFALYGVFVQSLQNGWGHCFEQRSDLIHYIARGEIFRFSPRYRGRSSADGQIP